MQLNQECSDYCEICDNRTKAISYLTKSEFQIYSGNKQHYTFKKGEQVITQGSKASHIVHVRSGLIKIHQKGIKDKDQILKIAKQFDYLGIPTVFGDYVNHYSATVIEECSVCFIKANAFKEIVKLNSKFAYEILTIVCQDELRFFNRFTNQSQKDLESKVAEMLLYFQNEIFLKNEFVIPLSREELSDFIGSSRESITRTLSKFKQQGLIDFHTKSIKIIEPQMLMQISAEG